MNKLPFLKMHGLGNDFVVIDARRGNIALSADLMRWIGDRHRGVGFDQLVLVECDEQSDARIHFFNADGSRTGACGNASRCLAAWLAAELAKDALTLRSDAGLLPARILADGRIEVTMTNPQLGWADIPLAKACDTLEVPLEHAGLPRPAAVNMGNPHVVFLVEDVDAVERHGPALERHPLFPERANIGFARVESRERMRLRVYERGAGLTLACGSGACAAHVAAHRRGLVGDCSSIELDGGKVEIAWAGQGPVVMTGPAAISFRGEIDLDSIEVKASARPSAEQLAGAA